MSQSKKSFSIFSVIAWCVFIGVCAVWALSADAKPADKCLPLADISEYAYWECKGASCMADCNAINPDKPAYCAEVCK